MISELRRYSKSWRKPAVSRDLARYDSYGEERDTKIELLFRPRGAQIEALYALQDSREEGAVRGLVQAATGIGKTYLAAFDSAGYKRVLFVAHREEILKQAAVSFRNVRNSDDYGFFYGKQKDTDKSVIFASVATLGREEYLKREVFAEDYFDYIVIDEFHHAVNDQYQKIVHYFKPQFLLGLTATPERMDGKDIYGICDYNVPYEISLKEAINKGMLVPFHYYGIYDTIDYSGLRRVKGAYVEKELTEIYRENADRYDLIYKYYRKYRSKRALGFCCSRQHAEDMAGEFCKRGIPAAAVYSNADGEFSQDRQEAIRRLEKQEIKVIFSVDMFNEGLDIASLDMVMFLRPTESPIVFLQQLGRGLRTYKGKEYLNVLDFIGNYEKAGKAPLLLAGGKSFTEMFYHMEDEVYQYCMKHAKENPFRGYLEFLHDLHELSEEEAVLYGGIGREFLSIMETTDMQKVYKMPILYSFYHDGDIQMAVTEKEVLESWKKFFDTGTNWKDFSADISYEEYKKMTDRQHLSKAKSMPIRFLKASGKGFFIDREGYAIALREELEECIDNKAFQYHMRDILEYRTMEYYRRRYMER